MRASSVLQNLNRVVNEILEAHVPMCVLLDFTTFRLYKTRR
jgi:hypothetical protein